ncbi:GHKL domain-containing protein [Erythrobacter sp. 3-20A1M]|uniref:GHKL domain-containing protein n=1 Tax=Erythrobacter sp. 3-20A1M TaxID=2653850 RepID=UPI001BFC9353|nr:GHKL domain-containing protein [Erythrobacter sp. 3-20A1M]QWC57496.1 GHKL domain-containing protein [Erythrobacter sp. 3-20A1M]
MHRRRTSSPRHWCDRPRDHELRHRFANELASTLAALHLTKASGDRSALIDQAIDRVEAQSRLFRFLVDPLPATCNLMEHVAELCHLLLRSRRSDGLVKMKVSVVTIIVPSQVAEAVLTIMNELLVNALKRVDRGVIDVRASIDTDALTFTVANDCHQEPARAQIHGVGVEAIRQIADEYGALLDFGVRESRFEARLIWPAEREGDPEPDDDLPF